MKPVAGMMSIAFFAVFAGACVSMPDFDAVEGTPEEFKAELANIDGYPETANTPRTPTDLTSGAVFDVRANKLLARSGAFDAVDALKMLSAQDMANARRQLLAIVNEYKFDDPQ